MKRQLQLFLNQARVSAVLRCCSAVLSLCAGHLAVFCIHRGRPKASGHQQHSFEHGCPRRPSRCRPTARFSDGTSTTVAVAAVAALQHSKAVLAASAGALAGICRLQQHSRGRRALHGQIVSASGGKVDQEVGGSVAPGTVANEGLDLFESLQMWLGAALSSSRIVTAFWTTVLTKSFAPLMRMWQPDVLVDPAAVDPTKRSEGEVGRPEAHLVSSDPDMWVIPQALNDEEVDHLLALAGSRWEQSLVAYGTKGAERSLMDRSSYQCRVEPAETPIVRHIEEHLAHLANMDVDHMERLWLVRYTPGQCFAVHHDGPDRPITIFLYLNDLPEGDEGETHFPAMGLKITPRRGCAVMWANCSSPDTADKRMFHQGLRPRTSVKYGVNCFFNSKRQR
mmetsp:Transcript_73090/g.144954  ORF Transcript_73090/g.144954 Transcript_73090/m.144954 type:complete len:394 (+) Transcript_73090:79-1260(+)